MAVTGRVQVIPGYEGDPNVAAYKGMNDRILLGKFGYLVYQNLLENENSYYCPWRIEFKYNAEHTLNSESPDGLEILVYHKENTGISFATSDDP